LATLVRNKIFNIWIGIGITSLAYRGCGKSIFDEDFFDSTIGFEFLNFNIRINNEIIKLQVWDICVQEIYRSLIPNFYRCSSLAIIVYSIDK